MNGKPLDLFYLEEERLAFEEVYDPDHYSSYWDSKSGGYTWKDGIYLRSRGPDKINNLWFNWRLERLKEQNHQDFEDQLEKAFWEFDARRSGYGKHRECPQSERDAFKWAVREMQSFKSSG